MGTMLEATVNLPGGFKKGTVREVDPDDEQIAEWREAGHLVAPTEGARRARSRLAAEARQREAEEGESTARQGIEGDPPQVIGAGDPADAAPPAPAPRRR